MQVSLQVIRPIVNSSNPLLSLALVLHLLWHRTGTIMTFKKDSACMTRLERKTKPFSNMQYFRIQRCRFRLQIVVKLQLPLYMWVALCGHAFRLLSSGSVWRSGCMTSLQSNKLPFKECMECLSGRVLPWQRSLRMYSRGFKLPLMSVVVGRRKVEHRTQHSLYLSCELLSSSGNDELIPRTIWPLTFALLTAHTVY